MDRASLLATQYADASELSTRAAFNDEYTVRDCHPHEWVRDEMGRDRDGTILDVGCGPGSF